MSIAGAICCIRNNRAVRLHLSAFSRRKVLIAQSDNVSANWKEIEMADKSPEEIELDKRAAERAAAHKEMKLAMGTSAHDAALRKHTLASEAHAKALIVAQKAATRARK